MYPTTHLYMQIIEFVLDMHNVNAHILSKLPANKEVAFKFEDIVESMDENI